MNIWWSVRSRMLVMGLWCCVWFESKMHLCCWWWMMDRDHKAWNVLSLCGLIMDRLDLNYWHMFYCINVMIWVWLMSGTTAKLWVSICRSVRGLALVKVRMYASLILHSSVYIMRYDIWSCSWIWLLLQSSVVYSVFWFQWFSIGWFKDWWWRYKLMIVLQWWLFCIYGSSLKIYETWSLEDCRVQ